MRGTLNRQLSRFFSSALVGLSLTLTVPGCARAPATGPTDAFREISTPALVSDDLELIGLADAIAAQANTLRSTPETLMRLGPVTISRGSYGAALEKLATVLRSDATREEKLAYVQDNFRFFEFYGGDSWGEVLLTSYFEPILRGSVRATPQYNRPLYKKPLDLVTIKLSSFAERFKGEKDLQARVDKGRVLPYFSREDIDGSRRIADRGLELVWVDPIDAFFLHIQGSGTITLESGQELHLTYAEKNGHRYEPIGKFLKEQIAPKKVTMQRIERLLREMDPKERDQILFKNPSYVFFNKSDRRAITSLGVPATPGRTIAVDQRFAPKGALVLLTFPKPVFAPGSVEGDDPISFEEVSRFVLDQDSGGAITGTNRVDLFWGRGDEAKRFAGVLQNTAVVRYLVPKDL